MKLFGQYILEITSQFLGMLLMGSETKDCVLNRRHIYAAIIIKFLNIYIYLYIYIYISDLKYILLWQVHPLLDHAANKQVSI